MTKRAGYIALLIALMLVMTGCGAGSDSGADETSGPEDIAIEEENEAVPEEDKETGTETAGQGSSSKALDTPLELEGHSEYEAALLNLRTAINTGEADWDMLPVDISEAMERNEIYYAFKDLNNDGTDEMVLGCEYENNIYPAGLYTIKDGEPYIPNIYMFSNIYDDGTLRVYGSDEAVQTEQFFRLKSNGELEHAKPGTDKDMTFNWHHI